MNIIDIIKMPGFNEVVTNGTDSVSVGKVYVKRLDFGEYPYCVKHGALLKVSRDGLWRCSVCNEGCYQHKIN